MATLSYPIAARAGPAPAAAYALGIYTQPAPGAGERCRTGPPPREHVCATADASRCAAPQKAGHSSVCRCAFLVPSLSPPNVPHPTPAPQLTHLPPSERRYRSSSAHAGRQRCAGTGCAGGQGRFAADVNLPWGSGRGRTVGGKAAPPGGCESGTRLLASQDASSSRVALRKDAAAYGTQHAWAARSWPRPCRSYCPWMTHAACTWGRDTAPPRPTSAAEPPACC